MRHMKAGPLGSAKFLHETRDERGEIRRRTIDIGAELVLDLIREWAGERRPAEGSWAMHIEPGGGSEEDGFLVRFTRNADWEEDQ